MVTMRKKSALISILYSIGQIALGLLVHPYQTMQSLVKERVFVWMAAIPLYVLVAVTVGWKFVVVPLVQVMFSCSTRYYLACDALSLISNTLIFFCWYWQVVLLYLLVRFRLVVKK
ncbi:MAG: hypothetical protein CO156_03260 [Candidatus Pacebacteria bacterium CG_4_9_14_3_um_filter_40_12]|nr:MAG: hypothetical protein COU64_00470 [Candidatus Pacebacteria bacterium CG10_big_fil_rev_8_21_14_0_10_40_26]PIZ79300.1 MAG: hypothetical protein COY01_02650 [Candidatus Pacebacteria bacterium CG_4_10_14_0_2_um_filter_40_20]PJA68956.1 MAG: hypothetical protein CO156_03260 [Candidatus Pacebacteria bacterium CG_4_9_14_3_um_filter_40_12]PJC42267.1 MAG: hypothetical protein CO041_01360 [Candidatus Pacebacteria bacterium CG_4_9_14_0_2_um_filter_40_15]